jgi:hypothetical protein
LRQFLYKDWQYTLEAFDRLSKKKRYARRFRVQYYFLAIANRTFSKKIKISLFYIVAYLNLALQVLKLQRKPFILENPNQIIVLISDNHAYIQNMRPLIQRLYDDNLPFTLLVPHNHLHAVKAKLGDELGALLIPIESVKISNAKAGWFGSLFGGIADASWFAFQSIKDSLTFSSTFALYGFTERYFGKQLRQFFTKDTRLIAANDHWFWESLYFTAARDKGTPNMIIQHGVIGDHTYPLFADKFLCWSRFDEQKLFTVLEARTDEVALVGSPYFDQVYHNIKDKKLTDNQAEQPYITFLTQPLMGTELIEPGYYEEILSRFYRLEKLAKLLNKKLVLKLHPQDKATHFANRPASIEILNEGLLDVLSKSCIAITLDSTSIYEAAMFEVPAIQSTVLNSMRDIDFSSSGISIRTISYEELEKAIDKLLSNAEAYKQQTNRANIALRAYYHDLGHSLDNILELLK